MYIFAQNMYLDYIELDENLHLASRHISLSHTQMCIKIKQIELSKQYNFCISNYK